MIATIMMTISGIAASLREKTENNERAAYDLDGADKRTHQLGIRNTDIRETPGAEDLGKGELLNSFGQKHDEAHQEANEDSPAFRTGSKQWSPIHQILLLSVPSAF